jgi:preprotein translocase subunit SecF
MTLPIIKLRNLWFTISGLLVAGSIIVLLAFPLKFGIDFTGGSLMEIAFTGERPAPAAVSDEPTHQKVLQELVGKFGGATERRFESIGPTVGEELRRGALWSISLVLLGIALYVSYAFRKVSRPVASWKYGLITLIVGLMHDVLLPVAAFALLGKFALAEVNSSFVAAVLTVLGFSVHDTIVVFDRIRENLLRSGGAFEEIVERSVNETLSRSINTSLTACLPLISIYVWGGQSLKYFAFTLIVGLVAGTYSSIFLASPMLVVMQKKNSR